MRVKKFGIRQCTVFKTIIEVCQAIIAMLGQYYLHLPLGK